MKTKKVVVRGPALSQSGYGEHTRFVLRSLRCRPDLFDIFLVNVNWGQTGWIWDDSSERRWIDALLQKTIMFTQEGGGKFDLSVQVQIPNEWQELAPVNIGVTAGIESTKISPEWVRGCETVDKIIVVSEHAKYAFVNTVYQVTDPKGNPLTAQVQQPIEVVGYPVKKTDSCKKFNLDLKYDFNFLTVGTWIPRKNLENTIKWFVEEFGEQEVGLIIKTSLARNCLQDRRFTFEKLQQILKNYKGRKCEVYLLHGDLNEEEMTSLYQHPKVKALVSLSHGEGFGLPLFEAAYNGLPIIAPNWSGHCDFLYMPVKDKKGKIKKTAMFSAVSYDIKPIQKEAQWNGVLQKDSMWCFPKEWNSKKVLRETYKNHGSAKARAKKLQKYLNKEFVRENQYKKLVDAIDPNNSEMKLDYIFVADAFPEQYVGGAELSLQALIDKTPGPNLKLNSNVIDEELINFYKDKKWVFGNFFMLPKEVMNIFSESKIKYSVIDSDYHFCEHRLKDLCMIYNGQDDCYCVEKTEHGKAVEKFMQNAELVFYRSDKHKEQHLEKLNLEPKKVKVLTSTIADPHLDFIAELREKYKDKKENYWVVSSSPSWVKGAAAAKAWCDQNEKKYVELHGKNYLETMETLAKAEGFCSLPPGADTCPRMVIEAKLLGCKLHINDNVLHAEEKWFDTEDLGVIEKYMRNIANNFWKLVGDKTSNRKVIKDENKFQDNHHNVQR